MGMWVSLPNDVRRKIHSLFSIPWSSATEVNDGQIVSDGTTHEDLKILTIEKMQKYLNEASTDFHKLFDMLVAKVNDEIKNPRKEEVVVSSTDSVNVIIAPKKRGRPSKKDAQK